MGRLFGTVRDAIATMRYGKSWEKFLYWFIRVAVIIVPILIIAVVAGVIYCNVNGIQIGF